MRKFIFSMLSILNVNITRKEVAEMALVSARAALAGEEKELDRIQSLISEAMELSRVPKNPSGSYFVQREKYVKMLNDRKKNQIYRIKQAEAKAQSCAERLKEAVIEVKRMEKAREIEYGKWELEFKREEQKINDETGNQRASRKIMEQAV